MTNVFKFGPVNISDLNRNSTLVVELSRTLVPRLVQDHRGDAFSLVNVSFPNSGLPVPQCECSIWLNLIDWGYRHVRYTLHFSVTTDSDSVCVCLGNFVHGCFSFPGFLGESEE